MNPNRNEEPMGIRDEFESEMERIHDNTEPISRRDLALHFSKWMAERIAIKREEESPHCCEDCPCSYWPEEIRKLAKELQ